MITIVFIFGFALPVMSGLLFALIVDRKYGDWSKDVDDVCDACFCYIKVEDRSIHHRYRHEWCEDIV